MSNSLNYAAMGERVRGRRAALEQTQGELAKQVGVSASFIGHIERGEKKASAETIVALCDALDVTTDYLLLGRENRCDRQACRLYEEFRALVSRYGNSG